MSLRTKLGWTLKTAAILVATASLNAGLYAQQDAADQPALSVLRRDQKASHEPGDLRIAAVSDSTEAAADSTHLAMNRKLKRDRLSTRDVERLLDEVRELRQDVRLLSQLIEQKLADKPPKQDSDVNHALPAAKEPTNAMLFFTASWCGPCQQMQPIIGKLQRQGFAIQKVDVDKNPDLAKRYDVMSIPQYVVVIDGKEVDRETGLTKEARLREMLQKLKNDVVLEQALSKRMRFVCNTMLLRPALKKVGSQFGVNIVLDSRGPEDEESISSTRINSIQVDDVSCLELLHRILKPLKLNYFIQGETIVVAAKLRPAPGITTIIYPVKDILKVSSEATEMEAAKKLSDLLCTTIWADSWEDVGGPGSIRFSEAAGVFVIRQRDVIHSKIAEVLAAIRDGGRRGKYHIDGASRPSDGLLVMTYSVADLLVPIPDGTGESRPLGATNWLNLIDRINELVEPELPEEIGGQGSVRVHQATMSLVVRARPATHGRIAEMLDGMRRLKDVQIVIDTRLLQTLDDSVFERAGLKIEFDERTRTAKLSEQEAEWLVEFVTSQQGKTLYAPKITIFDGQVAELATDVEGTGAHAEKLHLYVRGKAIPDRDEVRLNIAVNPRDLIDDLTSRSHRIPKGGCILIDMTAVSHGDQSELPKGRLLVLVGLTQIDASEGREAR